MAVKEKIRIRIKGYDHQLVDQSQRRSCRPRNVPAHGFPARYRLPTEKQVITILRAVHKYKDSREQFEMRTHKRLIDILRPSNKTVEALMAWNSPLALRSKSAVRLRVSTNHRMGSCWQKPTNNLHRR